MQDVNQLQVTIISIFPMDDISIPSLRRLESLNYLNHLFKLQLAQNADPFLLNQNQIVFRNGEFINDGDVFLVDEVLIDSRRLIIKINAPTVVGDKFFDQLRNELISLDVRENKPELKPLIKTYETSCVCKLSFDLNNYLGGSNVNGFLDDINKKIPNHGAKSRIFSSSIKFKIDFFNIPEEIRKNKITLSEKIILIEYRDKTNPEDKIYFTSSPTRSEEHFEILELFEEYIN